MDKNEFRTEKNYKIVTILTTISFTIAVFSLTISVLKTNNFIFFGSLSVVSFIIWFLISVTLHEVGHLIFGYISDYRLNYFQFLCFKFYRNELGRIRFKFIKPQLLGQCMMMFDEDIDKKTYKLYLYGGTIMNAFLTLVLTVLSIIFLIINNEYAFIFITGAFINLYLVLSNGIPLNLRNIHNDALNVKLMDKYPMIKYTILNSLILEKELSLRKEIGDFDNNLLDNNNYKVPTEYINGYPFVLLRFIRSFVGDHDEPFNELYKCYVDRTYYPSQYRETMIPLILYYHLISEKEYRGIVGAKENKFILSKRSKNPIVLIDNYLVQMKEGNLKPEKVRSLIFKVLDLIKKEKLDRVMYELIDKLVIVAAIYIDKKEEEDENPSNS